jgi:hypothetical protein
MSDIFVSYAREDLETAKALAEILHASGWSIFWDRSIPTGKAWRQVIGSALAEARCVVVIWSKSSIDSTWVQEEADSGRERGVLFPVIIESVKQPIGFGGLQATDLSSWNTVQRSSEVERLITDIGHLLGPPAPNHCSRTARRGQSKGHTTEDVRHLPELLHTANGQKARDVKRRLVEQGLKIFDWSEQFLPGSTILEECRRAADVSRRAVFILTRDDPKTVGANLVFEIGQFSASLGARRVIVLAEKGLELPFDVGGVLVVRLGAQGLDQVIKWAKAKETA